LQVFSLPYLLFNPLKRKFNTTWELGFRRLGVLMGRKVMKKRRSATNMDQAWGGTQGLLINKLWI